MAAHNPGHKADSPCRGSQQGTSPISRASERSVVLLVRLLFAYVEPLWKSKVQTLDTCQARCVIYGDSLTHCRRSGCHIPRNTPTHSSALRDPVKSNFSKFILFTKRFPHRPKVYLRALTMQIRNGREERTRPIASSLAVLAQWRASNPTSRTLG